VGGLSIAFSRRLNGQFLFLLKVMELVGRLLWMWIFQLKPFEAKQLMIYVVEA
jgi:hypothetical protein